MTVEPALSKGRANVKNETAINREVTGSVGPVHKANKITNASSNTKNPTRMSFRLDIPNFESRIVVTIPATTI